MQKLVCYYMRPLAVLILMTVSLLIIVSYLKLPTSITTSLLDSYQHYWTKLSLSLLLTTLFLGFAFYVEKPGMPTSGTQHLCAIVMILFSTNMLHSAFKIAKTFLGLF